MAADDKIDKAKGRAKEAAGDLTGDRDLENEGKADRAAGGFKETVNKAAGKLKSIVDRK
jgi:uncharacterized protein YjbJ (UPF0337 family)